MTVCTEYMGMYSVDILLKTITKSKFHQLDFGYIAYTTK